MPSLPLFETFRTLGAVPASPTYFYKLFSSKSHFLLYPGGIREALHPKGEEYKLFWPEQSEFVRMAARFGAKIVPFGVVGEDDIGQLVFDYDDQMKIPFIKDFIKDLPDKAMKLRFLAKSIELQWLVGGWRWRCSGLATQWSRRGGWISGWRWRCGAVVNESKKEETRRVERKTERRFSGERD
ncbi:hypothetical protein LguiA_019757 [Lonicera macranthoides]